VTAEELAIIAWIEQARGGRLTAPEDRIAIERARHAEAASNRGAPGLSIVILPATGGKPQAAYQPPMLLQLDGVPATEAEPAIPYDAE
jgi:hypothetical protein